MKKQLTILLLFLFTSTFAWSQDDNILKTETPCNIELILKTPGRWLRTKENHGAKVTSQERQQIWNRLNAIHQLVFNLYPSPMGADAIPTYFTTDNRFAYQLKMESGANGKLQASSVNGTPVVFYEYGASFCDYHCLGGPNEIQRSKYCEGAMHITIDINNLSLMFMALTLDDYYADIMRVEGRPIQMLSPIVGKWKGYDVYNHWGVVDRTNIVLLHREGMLPYVPVTRKQYLDRSIACMQKFYDKAIKDLEQPEGLLLLMDKKERDEQVKKQQQTRDKVIKFYRDELDASTKEGLLDSPAIISDNFASSNTNIPVFTTQAKGGIMLVTENPDYFRKDLPKYVPQLMVYYLANADSFVGHTINPFQLIDEHFPIGKLQAMIDK
jgi:hypothetical protein